MQNTPYNDRLRLQPSICICHYSSLQHLKLAMRISSANMKPIIDATGRLNYLHVYVSGERICFGVPRQMLLILQPLRDMQSTQ